MTVATITERGKITLPKELLPALRGATHVEVRRTATGMVLLPLAVGRPGTGAWKAIPAATPEAQATKTDTI